jgi:hypothetical protein
MGFHALVGKTHHCTVKTRSPDLFRKSGIILRPIPLKISKYKTTAGRRRG